VSHERSLSSRCTLSLPIFIPGLLFILALLAICSLAPEAAARFFGSGQSWIAQHFSWFYVLVVGMFLILLLVIAFSHFGNIRFGPDDARLSSASPPGSPCCSPPAWG
jgi:choline/glycine/proline betaine transport protein